MKLETLKFTVVDDELDTNAHLISRHHHEHTKRDSRILEGGVKFETWMFNNLVIINEKDAEPIVKILDRYDKLMSKSNFGDVIEENVIVKEFDAHYKTDELACLNGNMELNKSLYVVEMSDLSCQVNIFKGIFIKDSDISDTVDAINVIGGGQLMYRLEKKDFVTTTVGGQKVLKLSESGIPVIKLTYHNLHINIEHKSEKPINIKFVVIGIDNQNLADRMMFRPFELLLHKHRLIMFHYGMMGVTILHEGSPSEKYIKFYQDVEEEIKNRINFNPNCGKSNFSKYPFAFTS